MGDGDSDKLLAQLTDEEEGGEQCFPPQARKHRKLRKSLGELRHPRQKFCPRWEIDFRWLKADKVDESIGICTICNKELVCKKSHLERHQKSFKHLRLQGFEKFDSSGGNEADYGKMFPMLPEFFECGKQENSEFDQELADNAPHLEPFSAEMEQVVDAKPTRNLKRSMLLRSREAAAKTPKGPVEDSDKEKSRSPPLKLDRVKLLRRIDRERHELNEYYYSRRQLNSPIPAPPPQPPSTPKDSFDLFFESVSASVKTLPPKLAAEVKSRVSQIIAEYELRAISEREDQKKCADGLPAAPHTFQAKMPE